MYLFNDFRWQDVLDILIVGFVVYRLLLLIQGTRAVSMLIGLIVLAATYQGARYFELYTVNWVLDSIGNVILILVVVVFQHDIRRMLTRVGTGPFFGRMHRLVQGQAIEEITRASVLLAGRRIGAIFVLQREVGLNEYVEGGTRLDAQITKELLLSIFLPASPLHDGAVVLHQGRVVAAGCLLPLTTNPNVSKALGTRHRAAIGLTEETDAIAVVVSEEEGKISLVREGRITRDVDAGVLRSTLQQLVA
ncbi:MAG: TIGR00159 family protein [Deltaproteobacteria bacterium]|nr:TIGR00159 family protein [Deltaproteobacteria bacterium]